MRLEGVGIFLFFWWSGLLVFSQENRLINPVQKGLRILEHQVLTTKGTVLLESGDPILHLYSDSLRDFFFVYGDYRNTNGFIGGSIWQVSDSTARDRTGFQLFKVRPGYRQKGPLEIFSCGLLMTQHTDKSWLARDFKLDTLFQNRVIVDYLDADTLVPVFPIAGDQRYLYFNDRKVYLTRYWKLDEFVPNPYLIYYTHSKTGAVIFKKDYDGQKRQMVVFPPEFDTIDVSRESVRLLKNDTLWEVPVWKLQDPPDFRRNFSSVYKQKRNGNLREIRNFSNNRRSNLRIPEFLIPQTPFLGINTQIREYLEAETRDSLYYTTLNCELGIGWYESNADLDFWYGSWDYYGWGSSLEYCFPLRPRAEIRHHSGEDMRRLFFNIRAEGGAGVHLLFIPLSIQGQLGYSTDFRDHYLRPGLGISLLNVQVGMDLLLPLTKSGSSVYSLQSFYIRYHAFDY